MDDEETVEDSTESTLSARGTALTQDSIATGPARGSRTPSIARGTRVGDYEIERRIGEGGMSEVYRAVHPKIGRRVAVKVVSPRLLGDPEAIDRFVDEARVVAGIHHPGIVDVFGFGTLDDGRAYLIMEWLAGRSLGARLAAGRPEAHEAYDIVLQITSALHAAHEKGIVHRDLKPENVFVQDVPDEKPVVKLLDFGLAKLLGGEQEITRTRTGQLLGTPLYMSPEQCRAKSVDLRTDIYALGCICYQLFTGRLPFEADNVAELISAHLTQEPPDPVKLAPGMSRPLASLLVRMLAKAAHDRPTLREVRATIQAIAGRSSGPLAIPPSPQDEDVLTIEEGTRDDIALQTSRSKLALASTMKDINNESTTVHASPRTVPWLLIAVLALLAAGGVLVAIVSH